MNDKAISTKGKTQVPLAVNLQGALMFGFVCLFLVSLFFSGLDGAPKKRKVSNEEHQERRSVSTS